MDISGVKEFIRLKFVGSVVEKIKRFGARELTSSGEGKFMCSGVREYMRWEVQAIDSSGVREFIRLKFVGSVVQKIKRFGTRELMSSGV